MCLMICVTNMQKLGNQEGEKYFYMALHVKYTSFQKIWRLVLSTWNGPVIVYQQLRNYQLKMASYTYLL